MILYRYISDDPMKRSFESLAIYCREFTSVVPITFVMGFYVTFIVGRWWQQYVNIPWPDKVCLQISAYIHGSDVRSRMIRRSLARYINLISALTFQNISTVIKRRFPTISHLVEAGILTAEEKDMLDNTQTPHGIWWVPSHWFCQLAVTARKEGRIHDDLHLKSLIDDCLEYRGNCGMIWSYDWISVPLVYTQVVTIAVYSFFVACLFGRQFLLVEDAKLPRGHSIDFYVPIFSIFQFFFYVGWLKVAESMICPFGEDDDDFDMNWIVDRNLQVSLLIVDGLHGEEPPLTQDFFWDSVGAELPYTHGASKYRADPFVGSTMAMDISDHDTAWEVDQMPAITEEECHGSKKSSFCRDDDADSVYSRKYERRHRIRLGALPFGLSQQTLFSRFGSRKSVSSVPPRYACRSPPQVKRSLAEQNFSFVPRKKCSPDANEKHHGLNGSRSGSVLSQVNEISQSTSYSVDPGNGVEVTPPVTEELTPVVCIGPHDGSTRKNNEEEYSSSGSTVLFSSATKLLPR
ncbi:Bestrophin [Trichostrongylus colubriformis]|uniref:Bestrophin homolog n=1 Tax=Trichostrongylus colubriformis TaxID=6319 RepID=A0AAN8F906_TRICO